MIVSMWDVEMGLAYDFRQDEGVGLPTPNSFVLCDDEDESPQHLFFNFHYSKEVWNGVQEYGASTQDQDATTIRNCKHR